MDEKLNNNHETPTLRPPHKMSSSLKKKLRKLGRYHGSRAPPKLQRKTLSWSPSAGASSPPYESPKTDPTPSDDIPLNRSLPEVTSTASSDPSVSFDACTSGDGENLNKSNAGKDDWEELVVSGGHHNRTWREDVCAVSKDVDEEVDLEKRLGLSKKKVGEREELLRKLKLVKLYRTKNDLDQLKREIGRWRTACQDALMEYREKCQEPAPSLTDIINHVQIDHELIRYSAEEGGFMEY